VGTSAALIIRLSLGLAILYGLVIVVWYELLRSLLGRRRAGAKATQAPHAETPQAEHGEPVGVGEDHGHRAEMESELERARRHYRLAREEARTERDAAIATAGQAADQAIERIEGRYREIDAAFTDEETEQILELLRRPSGDETPWRDETPWPADGGRP
jgi:hypothetical protein